MNFFQGHHVSRRTVQVVLRNLNYIYQNQLNPTVMQGGALSWYSQLRAYQSVVFPDQAFDTTCISQIRTNILTEKFYFHGRFSIYFNVNNTNCSFSQLQFFEVNTSPYHFHGCIYYKILSNF